MGLSGLCRRCPRSGRQPIRPARRKTVAPCKAAWPLTLEIFSEGGALLEIEFLRLARTNLIIMPTGRAPRAADPRGYTPAPRFCAPTFTPVLRFPQAQATRSLSARTRCKYREQNVAY